MRTTKTLIRLGGCPGSDWADAQADLSLRWAHTHFVGFVMPRLILFALWQIIYSLTSLFDLINVRATRNYLFCYGDNFSTMVLNYEMWIFTVCPMSCIIYMYLFKNLVLMYWCIVCFPLSVCIVLFCPSVRLSVFVYLLIYFFYYYYLFIPFSFKRLSENSAPAFVCIPGITQHISVFYEACNNFIYMPLSPHPYHGVSKHLFLRVIRN